MLEEFSDSLISLNWENVYAKPIEFRSKIQQSLEASEKNNESNQDDVIDLVSIDDQNVNGNDEENDEENENEDDSDAESEEENDEDNNGPESDDNDDIEDENEVEKEDEIVSEVIENSEEENNILGELVELLDDDSIDFSAALIVPDRLDEELPNPDRLQQ
jgi:hypothetical protein